MVCRLGFFWADVGRDRAIAVSYHQGPQVRSSIMTGSWSPATCWYCPSSLSLSFCRRWPFQIEAVSLDHLLPRRQVMRRHDQWPQYAWEAPLRQYKRWLLRRGIWPCCILPPIWCLWCARRIGGYPFVRLLRNTCGKRFGENKAALVTFDGDNRDPPGKSAQFRLRSILKTVQFLSWLIQWTWQLIDTETRKPLLHAHSVG